MKCPILSMPTARTAFTEHFADIDCLQYKCAWWDDEKQACSVKVIAKELTRMQIKTGGK